MRRGASLFMRLTAALAASLAALASGAQAAPRRAAPLTLPPPVAAPGGVAVTMKPVGLSIEYPLLAQALGTKPCPAPALTAELLRLGSPPLRLGGVSQDLTAPAGVLVAPLQSWEQAIAYSLPSAFWSQLGCLLAASHDPLTVGLDARIGALAWAQQMVAEAERVAVGGVNFSIGNEPDLYSLPDYSALGLHLADEARAVATYERVAVALRPALGGAPLLGPDLSRPERWRRLLPSVISALAMQVVGVHMYPLSVCRSPLDVTLAGLLSPEAGQAPRRLAWVVADASAAHIPAIISEANSASCGGRAGVSDTPAAAVWAARFTISALETGFREVRFHLSGGAYDPFFVVGSSVVERPLAAALAALNRWLPVGCTLRPLAAASGVFASAVAGAPAGARMLIESYAARPRIVRVPASAPVQLQVISAAGAGVRGATARLAHGYVQFTLPPQSVVALLAPALARPGVSSAGG